MRLLFIVIVLINFGLNYDNCLVCELNKGDIRFVFLLGVVLVILR